MTVTIAIEHRPVEIVSVLIKNCDFPITNGDFPITNSDFPQKLESLNLMGHGGHGIAPSIDTKRHRCALTPVVRLCSHRRWGQIRAESLSELVTF